MSRIYETLSGPAFLRRCEDMREVLKPLLDSSKGKTAIDRWIEMGGPHFKSAESTLQYIDSISKVVDYGVAGNGVKRSYKTLLLGAIIIHEPGATLAEMISAARANVAYSGKLKKYLSAVEMGDVEVGVRLCLMSTGPAAQVLLKVSETHKALAHFSRTKTTVKAPGVADLACWSLDIGQDAASSWPYDHRGEKAASALPGRAVPPPAPPVSPRLAKAQSDWDANYATFDNDTKGRKQAVTRASMADYALKKVATAAAEEALKSKPGDKAALGALEVARKEEAASKAEAERVGKEWKVEEAKARADWAASVGPRPT